MSLQDDEAVSRVNVKYLNGMQMVLHFKNEKSNPVWIQNLVPLKMLHSILLHLTSPDPILSQNDKKKHSHENDDPGMSSPNSCHWLRPRKSWLYKLSSICTHAAKYEVAPMVTFDQPQSWKAFIIMYDEKQGSKLHSIILRLGGFPTWMIFVVSIDHGILWYRVPVVKDICRLHSQSHGLWWGICESH